ncbi:MAG: hypothetical protein AABX72_01765 [Nanoarchaeota archaeon]
MKFDGGFTAARAVKDRPPKNTENTAAPKQNMSRRLEENSAEEIKELTLE